MKSLLNIINELEVDRATNYLKSMRKSHQQFSIPFVVKDKEYELAIIEMELSNSEIVASFIFKNLSAAKGNGILVCAKVFNILIAYLEKYKPNYIHYFATEKNRKTLYNKILNRLQQKTSIQLFQQFQNPVDGSKLQPDEFLYQVRQKEL